MDLGTPQTIVTAHRVGVDSGAGHLWFGLEYIAKRKPDLLKKNRVNAQVEQIVLRPCAYHICSESCVKIHLWLLGWL